jgi:Flp pilus assembly pilin Flp
MSNEIDLLDTSTHAPAGTSGDGALTRLAQRGLTTAEYAVGILGVIAFALIVYTTISNNKIADFILAKVLDGIKYFAGKMR